MNANDLALGKNLSENTQRHAVVGIMKGWHEHQIVGDIKIRVTGGQPLAAKNNWARQRQFHKSELLAIQSARSLETGQFFRQRHMIVVSSIRLDSGHNRCGSNKARNVVYVAMRVIAGDSAIKPQHLLDAEIVAEGGFQLF